MESVFFNSINKAHRNYVRRFRFKNLSKSKLEESKPNLLLKPKDVEVLTEEYKTLFTEQEEFIKKENTYPFIFDCLNFIHYVKSKDEKPKSKQLDQDKLSALYSSLSEKGTLAILGDYHILKQLPSSLVKTFGDNFLTKLFFKLYIVSKSPMLSVMFIQKMSVSEKPIDIMNEKLLSYEIYEDLSITKPISYTISCMGKSLTYIYEMFRVRLYLQNQYVGRADYLLIYGSAKLSSSSYSHYRWSSAYNSSSHTSWQEVTPLDTIVINGQKYSMQTPSPYSKSIAFSISRPHKVWQVQTREA